MSERGLKQHLGAPVESTDEFNNAALPVSQKNGKSDSLVIHNELNITEMPAQIKLDIL